ncbi:MAG: hypothetical protein KF826_03435 [Xanthobacteraceae bacterium]|nr:hypothetical protein [Xanthobacteraceae bacterium]
MASEGLFEVRSFGRDCLGNITGYVIRRGFGLKAEDAGVFVGNIYRPGSFEKAKQEAEARCASINAALIGAEAN